MGDGYSVTLEMTRGGDTNNRDKLKSKASAETVDELREKVDAIRDEMEEWADDLRDIQPEYERPLPEDQSQFSEVEA